MLRDARTREDSLPGRTTHPRHGDSALTPGWECAPVTPACLRRQRIFGEDATRCCGMFACMRCRVYAAFIDDALVLGTRSALTVNSY
jgi:hypothetical protein